VPRAKTNNKTMKPYGLYYRQCYRVVCLKTLGFSPAAVLFLGRNEGGANVPSSSKV